MQALQPKPSLVIGVAATLTSTPLVLLLGGIDHPLLRVSPVLLGLVAVAWYGTLHARGIARGAWLGALTLLCTFVSFVVALGLGAFFSAGASWAGVPGALRVLAGMAICGLGLFGWFAVGVGAIAGWLAARLHAQEA